MEIVFMGTPDFAVTSLMELAKEPGIDIKGVITQPDRPRGRGQHLQPPPVKEKGVELGLDIFQPGDINETDFIKILKKLNPEGIVVVAFGQKLGDKILSLPEYGCINLHASLLPEYRGASPIHQAIINGDGLTGVTTMYMNKGWDTGDIIYKKEVEIDRKDTVGLLHDRLAITGARLLVKTLLDIEKGTAPREKQDETRASYSPKINKKTGKINWSLPAEEIYNLVRGVNPWPGAYTKLEGQLLKIWQVSPTDLTGKNKLTGEPGEIISAEPDQGIIVKTGKGFLKIDELQLAGRKRMGFKDFLRGYNMEKGQKFI